MTIYVLVILAINIITYAIITGIALYEDNLSVFISSSVMACATIVALVFTALQL